MAATYFRPGISPDLSGISNVHLEFGRSIGYAEFNYRSGICCGFNATLEFCTWLLEVISSPDFLGLDLETVVDQALENLQMWPDTDS